MIELKCPNCNIVLEVQKNKEKIVCKKCLNTYGKHFIMIESKNNSYQNMGDGFFIKE